jgi:hypothetical protein
MRCFFIVVFCVFCSLFFHGQTPSVDQMRTPGIYLSDGTKLNEYKKTYEIKEIANPDLLTQSKIDMSKYWKFIDANNRVEVIDDATDLTLILYSRTESNALIDFKSVLIVMPADHKRDDKKSY